jgi:Na+/H+ antiporter NhaD/arsenite permease-like protein
LNSTIVVFFLFGYLLIIFEEKIHINKTASALATGIICWVFLSFGNGISNQLLLDSLSHHLAGISEILFFLLGAMTIVEVIDSHNGFRIVTSRIKANNMIELVWIFSIISFFLSAVLDNLTTTIVMVSLCRKMVFNIKARLYMVSMVVIAANAGGAWSPIGDVTTTMLWVSGNVSSMGVISKLFLPSLINLLIPLVLVSFFIGNEKVIPAKANQESEKVDGEVLILIIGLSGLLLVPVFKNITHLPPYMGILLALSILWALTEWIHKSKEPHSRSLYTPGHALAKIDTPSILFFLGILLAVSALETCGAMKDFAQLLDITLGNKSLIVFVIGLGSAVIDNVPLVAASIAMYDLQTIPMDDSFWIFLAYAAGTGGSILIIGSAAGVAAMGMEKIDFLWYTKRISLLAFSGYLGGSMCYLLLN